MKKGGVVVVVVIASLFDSSRRPPLPPSETMIALVNFKDVIIGESTRTLCEFRVIETPVKEDALLNPVRIVFEPKKKLPGRDELEGNTLVLTKQEGNFLAIRKAITFASTIDNSCDGKSTRAPKT